jgi:hypothetical protein
MIRSLISKTGEKTAEQNSQYEERDAGIITITPSA